MTTSLPGNFPGGKGQQWGEDPLDAGWGSGSCCPSRTFPSPLSNTPLLHHLLILQTQ